jgi:hypothetical protein
MTRVIASAVSSTSGRSRCSAKWSSTLLRVVAMEWEGAPLATPVLAPLHLVGLDTGGAASVRRYTRRAQVLRPGAFRARLALGSVLRSR